MTTSSAPRRRVLLIGLDSADAELIERWTDDGTMPVLARLRREAAWRRLATTAEIMHVSAWPTLYTGVTPGHHGMYHAFQVRSGVHGIQRTEPQWCAQPPFWQALDAAGRRCVIFDAFMDYPLPGFKGKQILEYGTWTWFGEPGSTPRGLLGDIRRRFGIYPAPEHADQVEVPSDPLRFRDQLVAGTAVKARITRALMDENDWDFLFVTFGEPHGAGHYLWHFEDTAYPLQANDETLRGKTLVRDVYAGVDRAIGEILEAADDGTTVIVASGDGMGPNYSGCHLMPELLHRMDLFKGGGVGGDSKKASRAGLLQSLRQAVPLGFRQRVTRCLPKPVRYRLGMKWVNSAIDWRQSRVYCVPNSNEGYFRVNLAGREPSGIVAPGAEYDDILGSLVEQLRLLRAPASGARAAERVTLMDATFQGARRGDLPDAVISWNNDARIVDAVDNPSFGTLRGKAGYQISPFYTGNHRALAFALVRAANWNGFADANRPDVLDIAPTILTLLGVDPPGRYEGQSWYRGRAGTA
jgi:predicted AlkP superfamily phosphohydrolase/phosphomutase